MLAPSGSNSSAPATIVGGSGNMTLEVLLRLKSSCGVAKAKLCSVSDPED